MRNRITFLSMLLLTAVLATVCGCVSATATRTTTAADGSATTDTIKTSAFLENISNGSYSNGTGMTLSVNSATPDQQSIATLAGGVVEMGKLFAASKSTNGVVSTNAVDVGTNAAARRVP